MAYGKNVQLYLVHGTPGGLVIAEILSWTGKVFACPRANLNSLLKREEMLGTGVYIQLGDDPENPQYPLAYIGETDELKRRLTQHNQNPASDSDWWNRVIAITNKDLNVTKAHVRYLENRMIKKANAAKRSRLRNGNTAVKSPLPEAAQSDMEQFLEQLELILPLLNVNILRKPATVTTTTATRSTPDSGTAVDTPTSNSTTVFRIHAGKLGVTAEAEEVDGEFVVLKGSEARAAFSTANHSYANLRDRLIEEGVFDQTSDSNKLIFNADVPFASPSAAAAMVLGRNANGRTEWKVQGTGQTYAKWQESRVATEPDSNTI